MFEDNLQIWSKINYTSIFDRYYGIVNRTEEIENDRYLQENFQIQIKFKPKLFGKRLNLGINYEFRKMNVADRRCNPYLDSELFRASGGGTTSGFVLATSWDSSDNIFYPYTYGYYDFRSSNFAVFMGSDFDYRKFVFDFRRCFRLPINHIIAVQTYFIIENGSPPFYDLALLGGDRLMRGYLM